MATRLGGDRLTCWFCESGQSLAYVSEAEAHHAKVLTMNQARRIARLPDLLGATCQEHLEAPGVNHPPSGSH